MNYPFSTGDLLCAGQTASTYLDNNVKVPWDDLRYLFGEILYGGHIVEDWDRRLSSAYLHKHFNEGLLELPELFPDFTLPQTNANHKGVRPHLESPLQHTAHVFALMRTLASCIWPESCCRFRK